ncbi:MAG: hypothetical protein FWH38_00235 [Treponema sp.]|nr:hypothetical protein [Treponema sp.]MCL2126654.1 hypothetical protein [Treponema sp.]
MNGYERVRAVLKGEKPDKVPLMLHSFMPAAEEAGLTMEEYRNSPRNMARAHVKFARKYGLDGILLDVDTAVAAGAIGARVDFPVNAPARVAGPAAPDIDRLIEIMSPEKLRQSDRIKIMLEAVGIMKRETGGEILIRGNCDQMAFSLALLCYGMEEFLTDLFDEELEEKILCLIDRALLVHLEFHRMMSEAGADITSFGDSPAGPDVISRNMFLKYALPFHYKLKQQLDLLGIETICHICGNLDLIVEDLAAVGYAGVEIDYKTDIVRAAGIMNNRSVVFGVIDPSGVFFFGSPDSVRKETLRVLDCFAGTGIVPGAGCALPPGVPERNIRSFVETARGYPI